MNIGNNNNTNANTSGKLNNMTTYYSHLIPAPSIITPDENKSIITIIDSMDRNRYLFPNSNDYVITLPSPLLDIVEIELISAYYKYTNYELDDRNNRIFLYNVSKNEHITVPILKGNYSTEELISQYTSQYENITSITNNIDYSISMKYSSTLERYYFTIDNNDVIECHFKGEEQTFPNNLYGTVTKDTNIFSYKNGTNGMYFGYSENNFSNKLEIFSMKIINNNLDSYNHTVVLQFENIRHCIQLAETLQLFDDSLKLTLVNTINGENTKYFLEKANIKGFSIISKKEIHIMVTLSENISNELILNPTLYTNIILGDIISNSIRDNYVLLDIKEINRIQSINKNVQDSYVKIPINQQDHIYFDNTKNYGNIKYCNPIIRSLDRLTINIKDRNGNLIESNGSNNVFVFAFKCLNNGHTLS
tara:strand:+ start:5329 stop:6588 length:1260 start_codon:yes stop_codon:yes gene_type:complete